MRGRTPRKIVTKTYVERLLWEAGYTRVAGVDEVGMGPLAGPVVAAAVVFPPGRAMKGIADSKQMTRLARERMVVKIRARALGVGLGIVEPEEIDRLNIYQAGLKAMRLAVEALPFTPDHVVVDARHIPGIIVPQTGYGHGDSFVYSIAAASIVAKVHRDDLMRRLDAEYPHYGFRRHVGYATREHLAALRAFGPSPLHRRSFAPCVAAGAVAPAAS
ncbi:MAG: ribonuclease HII [Deltaproteobacteria bacterium]|nr:ribonuclease HII [Deltaproteobacteria bacterium]